MIRSVFIYMTCNIDFSSRGSPSFLIYNNVIILLGVYMYKSRNGHQVHLYVAEILSLQADCFLMFKKYFHSGINFNQAEI